MSSLEDFEQRLNEVHTVVNNALGGSNIFF